MPQPHANKIAFVIATKDRPRDLRTMLSSLSAQSCHPDQIVLVDASAEVDKKIAEEFPLLNIEYIRYTRPSASAQRNAGIQAVRCEVDLIGFLDDDVVLEPEALEAMLTFWDNASDDTGGCGFNLKNFEPAGMERLKYSSLARRLGLYSQEKGIVMPSGWQTMIGEVSLATRVSWLGTGASVWRKEIFERFRFEEYFAGYSYLEDLDFSYGVSRSYNLFVVADAGFYHYHSSSGRIGSYDFGKIEVANRLFFVRKHGLSLGRCYTALIIRLLMTIWTGLTGLNGKAFQRAWGNCVGLAKGLFVRVKA